jgi:hypothetical protein
MVDGCTANASASALGRLRAAAGEHDQRPVLGEGDVVVDRSEGAHRHRQQDPRLPQHRVDHLLGR